VVAELAASADLGRVLDTAREQRVAPLVLRALDAAGVEVGEVAAAARREAAFRRGQELVAIPLVVEHAIVPLHAAGLTPLVHKGAALLGRYPAPGLRPMDDVDLVVPADRLRDAISVLEGAGWARAGHSDEVPDPGYDVPMVHPRTGGLPIELHYDLQRPSQRTSEVDASRLWSERVPATVCGQTVWGVAPELELLALATHAAKPFHAFNRLIWATDLAVVIGAASIDWDTVARRVVELRCRSAVAVGLRLARRLGADVPDELVALPAFARRTGALEPVLDPRWPFVVGDRNRSGFALALVDDHRSRGRLIVDQVRRADGRSPVGTVHDLLGAAYRFVRRASLTGRRGADRPAGPSPRGGASAGAARERDG
jgi:hypothetical protein